MKFWGATVVSVSCNSYNIVCLDQGIKPYIIYFSDWHKHKDSDNFIFNSFAFYTHTWEFIWWTFVVFVISSFDFITLLHQ